MNHFEIGQTYVSCDLCEDAMTIRKAVVQCQELSKSGKLQDFSDSLVSMKKYRWNTAMAAMD
jgi:hypothetical protein